MCMGKHGSPKEANPIIFFDGVCYDIRRHENYIGNITDNDNDKNCEVDMNNEQ